MVVFVLATGSQLNIRGAQFCIGEIVAFGRSLLLVGKYSEQDVVTAKSELQRKLAAIPVTEEMLSRANDPEQLAMHLYGIEGEQLVVTEVHNVNFARANK